MKQLRFYRQKRGLTMKELGDRIGCAESTISLYENGKREPNFETLLKLAEELEVSTDDLLREKTKNQPTESELNEWFYEYVSDLTPTEIEKVAEYISDRDVSYYTEAMVQFYE